MKLLLSIAAAAAACASAPMAAAQTAPAATPAPAPKAGATVFDGTGTEVGTIEKVDGGNAVLFTGKNRVTVPLTSFGTSPKGPTFGMTRAEVDAAAEKAAAASQDQLTAALQPGAAVRGQSRQAVVATVKEVKDGNVTVTATGGEVVVPVAAFGYAPEGLYINMSAADFDAAVAAAVQPAASAEPAPAE